MSVEYWFLFICLGTLVLITLGLIFNTVISGSNYFKSFQLLMSAMQYSDEAEETTTLILNKLEANLLVAKISSCNTNIVFYASPVDLDGAEMSNQPAVAEIFIGSKYYAYGYIRKYYTEAKAELTKKRPSIKTLKRIIALEKKLRGDVTKNDSPTVVNTKKKNNVVELD
ncbi:hypothetical protein ACRYKS_19960 [Escherichia coli]|uniref:hypothetical protein n=1 Tax=Escherichia coli TaxID=562 RepID=UPI001A503165|nr:hypothetical protein [Escherichia coli]VVY16484.1 Uncharacterised protein [Escherichia coli]